MDREAATGTSIRYNELKGSSGPEPNRPSKEWISSPTVASSNANPEAKAPHAALRVREEMSILHTMPASVTETPTGGRRFRAELAPRQDGQRAPSEEVVSEHWTKG
jgi:hypothetical protein